MNYLTLSITLRSHQYYESKVLHNTDKPDFQQPTSPLKVKTHYFKKNVSVVKVPGEINFFGHFAYKYGLGSK